MRVWPQKSVGYSKKGLREIRTRNREIRPLDREIRTRNREIRPRPVKLCGPPPKTFLPEPVKLLGPLLDPSSTPHWIPFPELYRTGRHGPEETWCGGSAFCEGGCPASSSFVSDTTGRRATAMAAPSTPSTPLKKLPSTSSETSESSTPQRVRNPGTPATAKSKVECTSYTYRYKCVFIDLISIYIYYKLYVIYIYIDVCVS